MSYGCNDRWASASPQEKRPQRLICPAARRGEVLALRWSDIVDGRAIIARSLTQTRSVLQFKGTKSTSRGT
jgi:integrase